MTQEQRDLTRNALRKYGERHWARTPENRRWQSAIDEGIDYYQVHDPMRADLLRMRFFEQRPEDEIFEQLHSILTPFMWVVHAHSQFDHNLDLGQKQPFKKLSFFL